MGLAIVAGCHLKVDPGVIPVDAAGALPEVQIDRSANSGETMIVGVVRAGSRTDPVGREGLASLTARAVARHPWPEGARTRVRVDREAAVFRVWCPADSAPECGEALVAALAGGPVSADRLAGARRDAEDALAISGETWGRSLSRSWMYTGHVYGHVPEGRRDILPLLQQREVHSFQARHYVRERIALGVLGAAAAETAGAMTRAASSLPARMSPLVPSPAPEAWPGEQVVRVHADVDRAIYWIGHPVDVAVDDADWPAWRVGARALANRIAAQGDSAESTPFVEMVASDGPQALQLSGTWTDGVDAGLQRVRSALELAVSEGFTDAEVEAAAASIRAEISALRASPDRRLEWSLRGQLSGVALSLESFDEALASVERQAVETAVRAHVRGDGLRALVWVPEGAPDADFRVDALLR